MWIPQGPLSFSQIQEHAHETLVWQFGLGHRREYAWCDIALHETNDKGVPFPCLFQNEVMIANNESWIFIHGYVIEIGKI